MKNRGAHANATISIRIPMSDYERLEIIAREKGIGLVPFVRLALYERMKREEKKQGQQ